MRWECLLPERDEEGAGKQEDSPAPCLHKHAVGSNESGGALPHICVSRFVPWPAPALGHRCRLWWSSAAACGNRQLLPEACLDKWHHGNLQQEPEDKLSPAHKGLDFLGSLLEDSEHMSLSTMES